MSLIRAHSCIVHIFLESSHFVITGDTEHWVTLANWVRQWAVTRAGVRTEQWVIWRVRARLQAPAPHSRQPEYDERSPAQPGPPSRGQQLPTLRQLLAGQCQYRNQIKPGSSLVSIIFIIIIFMSNYENLAIAAPNIGSRNMIIHFFMKFILVENMIISDRVESMICRRPVASLTKMISTIPENIFYLRQDIF